MPLRYRRQDIKVGSVTIHLQVLRDLRQFADPNRLAKDAGISEEAFPLFGIVWASSEVLADLMMDYEIAGKRILEVGCGIALVSHVLNYRGADITAMDIHPGSIELLASNSQLNMHPPIPFYHESWSDETLDLGKFDLIVGADILYEPKHVVNLAPFLHLHTKVNSEVIIVSPDRGEAKLFEQAMSGFGFSRKSSKPDFVDHLDLPYEGFIHRFSR